MGPEQGGFNPEEFKVTNEDTDELIQRVDQGQFTIDDTRLNKKDAQEEASMVRKMAQDVAFTRRLHETRQRIDADNPISSGDSYAPSEREVEEHGDVLAQSARRIQKTGGKPHEQPTNHEYQKALDELEKINN